MFGKEVLPTIRLSLGHTFQISWDFAVINVMVILNPPVATCQNISQNRRYLNKDPYANFQGFANRFET